jgi:hypothetical protein
MRPPEEFIFCNQKLPEATNALGEKWPVTGGSPRHGKPATLRSVTREQIGIEAPPFNILKSRKKR